MKRDPRLRGLSSEHHRALVLARTLARRVEEATVDAPLARELRVRFDREFEAHFRVEEEVLLPALRAAGEAALVERVERDHADLRACVDAAARGELDQVAMFAGRLAEHVRFEERELFPRCEETLPSAVLDEVRRRAPEVP